MTLDELRTAYRTLRAEVADACNPKSERFSPIAAERDEQEMCRYARLIADLVVDADLSVLAEV